MALNIEYTLGNSYVNSLNQIKSERIFLIKLKMTQLLF